jgi:transcriptional regulator with XRE-family HTH domain
MDTDLKAIGKRISQIIEGTGLSRKALGDSLGVGEAAVGRYIRGEVDAGAARLAKIAREGGVSTDWLITGEESKRPSVEITDEEIVRQILARPALRDQAINLAREQVHEKEEGYGCRDPIKKDLLKTYAQLPEKDRLHLAEYAQFLAHRNESRRNEGGGSSSAEGNCA